jgi:hypothetical protein
MNMLGDNHTFHYSLYRRYYISCITFIGVNHFDRHFYLLQYNFNDGQGFQNTPAICGWRIYEK